MRGAWQLGDLPQLAIALRGQPHELLLGSGSLFDMLRRESETAARLASGGGDLRSARPPVPPHHLGDGRRSYSAGINRRLTELMQYR